VRRAVEATLDNEPYQDRLTLLGIEFETERNLLTSEPESVVVTVGHPPGTTFPALRDELADRLSPYGVSVEVRFLAVDRPPDEQQD
jgi:hypothetical protein